MVRGCSNGKACQECARNCLVMHQKQRNPSVVVTRFFKIMVGEDYSQILFLPPTFVQRSRCYVGQQTHLEDTTGQRWPVMISDFDGSMAFLKGWNEFSVYHVLEVGQLLVFSYINESHFVVQIFGRSGLERLIFNRGSCRPKKRSRDGEEKVVREEVEPLQIVDKNLMVEPSLSPFAEPGESLPIVPRPTNISLDDPALVLNRDVGYNPGEDRSYLADLSCFETGNKFWADKTTERSLVEGMFLDHSPIRMLTESETNFQNDKKKNSVLDKEVPSVSLHNGSLPIPSKAPHVGKILRVKEELGDMGDVPFRLHQACTVEDPNKAILLPWRPLGTLKDIADIVKSEPDLLAPPRPFLVDVNYLSFLALSIFLPPIEGQMVEGTQVVYLKDSTNRLWPVLYSARSDFPAFLDGWKRFCEANSIHEGDVCNIKPEDNISSVYRIEVIPSK